MFTGIIREVGIIKSITENSGSKEFIIEAPETIKEKQLGDSIAIDGACHTITAFTDTTFTFTSIPETLKLTDLNDRKSGDKVNLEPAMKLGDTLDGHLVTGHIDTTTTVKNLEQEGDSTIITFNLPESIQKFIAYKGSVCINGVSLTVSSVTENTFAVSLIPHTLENTNLQGLKEGSKVNIEIDTIMRYAARLMEFK